MRSSSSSSEQFKSYDGLNLSDSQDSALYYGLIKKIKKEITSFYSLFTLNFVFRFPFGGNAIAIDRGNDSSHYNGIILMYVASDCAIQLLQYHFCCLQCKS